MAQSLSSAQARLAALPAEIESARTAGASAYATFQAASAFGPCWWQTAALRG
jgi:hypothetical protein